jgi:hypothetical protein
LPPPSVASLEETRGGITHGETQSGKIAAPLRQDLFQGLLISNCHLQNNRWPFFENTIQMIAPCQTPLDFGALSAQRLLWGKDSIVSALSIKERMWSLFLDCFLCSAKRLIVSGSTGAAWIFFLNLRATTLQQASGMHQEVP